MHRALPYRIISDILQYTVALICISVILNLSRKVLLARDSLAALVTTYKIFCEPAMDALWDTVIPCSLPPLERSYIDPQH